LKTFQHPLIFLLFLIGINYVAAQENISQAEKKFIQQIITKETAKRFKTDADRLRLKDQFTRYSNDWIFISYDIQNPSGQPFDYKGTHLYEVAQEEMFINSVEALLHKKNSHWELVDIAVNAYDVAWDGWDKKYNAPQHIFNIICLRQTPDNCQESSQIPAAWRGTWHPRNYGARSTISEPEMIIGEKTITWKPCGSNARKVRIFSKFFGQSGQDMLLEIEGEPCSHTNNENNINPISYIYLEKSKEKLEYIPHACPMEISIYDTSDNFGNKKHSEWNIYTKAKCSVFSSSKKN